MGNVKINACQVKAVRDCVAKGYKFKPWGAVKMAEKGTKFAGRAALAIAVLVEAWDWWSSYKKNKELAELKNELKDSVNNAFKELYDVFANEQQYYETFAPAYLDMLKALESRNEELEEMRARLDSYNDYRERLKQWYRSDIQDVEFEEI